MHQLPVIMFHFHGIPSVGRHTIIYIIQRHQVGLRHILLIPVKPQRQLKLIHQAHIISLLQLKIQMGIKVIILHMHTAL